MMIERCNRGILKIDFGWSQFTLWYRGIPSINVALKLKHIRKTLTIRNKHGVVLADLDRYRHPKYMLLLNWICYIRNGVYG